MKLILVKDGKTVSEYFPVSAKAAIQEYKRITRNAWRRKCAFNQVEFPDKLYMSWYEALRHGGCVHCYVELITE